ncbi:hypothetical protein BKA65DRAFT_29052 [Rhexocercosporidium sp. MPI-PUGE-AT-0058]|nr:hypothetical protein BKA65DRAFT_29052 [Rhexocercosporidium sp. MPI-PUGE-AT-0058]
MGNRMETGTSLLSHCDDTIEVPAAVPAQDHQARERYRVKELLRYFQPFQAPVRSDGKPQIATDTTLTALAQLAALKLNCQRSFISLIDNTKQYIVAEATQKISLVSEDVYGKENDELSFGQTVLDFKTGVCPGTIACFTSPDGSLDVSTTYIKASRSYYVMNDMSMLEGYKGRSYVRGWPHMRFYAEVPIHSPSGTCIGTLCVVDDKARDGLDLKGIRTLAEISETVMDHLELCVSKIQQNQAERMIQGLGHFVEGHINTRGSPIEAQAMPRQLHPHVEEQAEIELDLEMENLRILRPENLWDNMQPNRTLHNNKKPRRPVLSQEAENGVQKQLLLNDPTSNSTTVCTTAQSTPNTGDIVINTCAPIEDETRNDFLSSFPPLTCAEDKISGSDRKNRIDSSTHSSDHLDGILFRAANLIRETIGLNGVVFFHPRATSGRLLTNFTPSKPTGEGIALNIPQDASLNSGSFKSHPTLSRVMSCSIKSMRDHGDHIQMPEKTLQLLLKHFPSGGLMTFDDEGIVAVESLASLIGELKSAIHDITPAETCQDSFSINDIDLPDSELRRILPGVTSLMIYPFWNNVHNSCVAHCLAWTSEPARVFRRQEFTYVASFSNSVAAEMSRLEVVAADKAKSRFISSISHELRSPLHGIMASIEILRDLASDVSLQDLFRTIESCGSTLLDTIDNVLAFSQTSRQNVKEDGNLLPKPSQSADDPESAVDMEILVEEVTSICLTSVQFRMIVDSSAHHKQEQQRYGAKSSSKWDEVIVICDISPGDWLFLTNGAVWKRIILNLVGNALKYTSTGAIVVTLRQDMPPKDCPDTVMASDSQNLSSAERDPGPLSLVTAENLETSSDFPQRPLRRVVNLSVKDTGKGMSQDYLANFLFKPFYQENPLAPGTGLGLSIVDRLVRSIGGKINVSSEEGVGTEIKIEVSLERPEAQFEAPAAELPPFSNSILGIVGLNSSADLLKPPTSMSSLRSGALLALASTITRYAAASNLVTTSVGSVDSTPADIIFIQDSHYRLLEFSQVLALKKPLIVLCMEPLRAHEHTFKKPMNVVLLSNPFGPRKFQGVIDSCLQIHRSLLSAGPIEVTPDASILPLAQNPVAFPRTQTPDPIKGAVENTSVNKIERTGSSLLLVEDNPINLKLLVTSINRMGCPFMTATNGMEAVEAYKTSSTQILLIFMDIQMPMMDGIEASREIRSYEKQNSLPRSAIVALTALDSVDAKQAAADSGVDLFFTKPVSIKKLKEIVTQYYS